MLTGCEIEWERDKGEERGGEETERAHAEGEQMLLKARHFICVVGGSLCCRIE